MNYHFNFNQKKVIDRYDARFTKCQKYLDNEVLKDTTPYVPMRTGRLFGSGQQGTVIGSGQIVYNAPYARKCYYNNTANFGGTHKPHPQATSQWFEPSKAVNKKKWIAGVKKIARGD